MILTEFLVVLYADHVRFHPCHPYIESTDSLIVYKSLITRNNYKKTNCSFSVKSILSLIMISTIFGRS